MRARLRSLRHQLASIRWISLALSRREGRLGARAKISPSAQILGWRWIRIGEGTLISDHVCLNVNSRDEGIFLLIGKKVFVGAGSFFSTGEGIEIGDFCLIGRSCQLLNAGHRLDPRIPYAGSGIEALSSLKLGLNAWLTNSVVVVGGVSIGFGAVVGAGSVVVSDIPPLSLAFGNPAKPKKFFDWASSQWMKIDPEISYEEQLEAHLAQIPSEDEYRASLDQSVKVFDLLHKAIGASEGDIY